jgi:hypothetical protein
MRKTTAPIVSIAMACLCAGISGCASQASHAYRTSSLDAGWPKGRVCMVSDESCLSMMTEPPHTCPAFLTTTATEGCNTKGSSFNVAVDQRRDLTLDTGH